MLEPAHGAPVHRPLRILLLTDTAIVGSGGSERFLRNLLRHLPASDYQVTLVQLCAEPAAADRLHADAVRALAQQSYLPIGAVYSRAGLRAVRALRRTVREQGFDIIQSQHETADVVNALLPRGPAHAARISNRRDTGFLKSRKLRTAARVLDHRYDRIVAPSEAILAAVAQAEGAPRARMRCIPNGVDTEYFRPVADDARRAAKRELGLAEDAPVLGCVASLTPVKRHADLIDAFARVERELPQATLLLVGGGPLHGPIAAQSDALGLGDRVRLLGQRSNVQPVLQALDLFVLASETEGMSNAILEAQACGLPVVATRVGGNPDLVTAERGVLAPAHDPARLADAMLELLRNPDARTRMGTAARAHVLAHHSLASMAMAYDSLYRELAHGR